MSFDVNPLSNNIPQMKATQTQDGGAGNTGYFEQQKKKKEEEFNKSLFNEEKSKDTFTLEDAKDLNYNEPPLLLKIVDYFKSIIKNLFKK